jgi:hypothetical protein
MSGDSKGGLDRYWYSPKEYKLRSMAQVNLFMRMYYSSELGEDEEKTWKSFEKWKK